MSTALLEREGEAQAVELVLDPTTRQRIAVASCAVETLEDLADTGAWERLDPAIAEHLGSHAKRLRGFLERVRELRAVRTCERELLSVRRIERRLEVALDLLVEDEETEAAGPAAPRRKAKSSDEAFLGDFTNAELTSKQREQVQVRRRAKKEARKLLSPQAKRVLLYVLTCFLLTSGSLFLVALGALQGQGQEAGGAPPVEQPMELNPYVEDLQVFLPAKLVTVQRGTAIVMVRRAWQARTEDQRRVDADGAHVFLSNRNVPRLELYWEDGPHGGTAERNGHFVFVEGPRARAADADAEVPPETGAEGEGFVPPGLEKPSGP